MEKSIDHLSNVRTNKDNFFLKKLNKYSFLTSRLSRAAISILSIPASSATPERVFSETGRMLEARRQQLGPETLDALVFLRNF